MFEFLTLPQKSIRISSPCLRRLSSSMGMQQYVGGARLSKENDVIVDMIVVGGSFATEGTLD